MKASSTKKTDGIEMGEDSHPSGVSTGQLAKRPDPIHGFIFQLKLLMLFLFRGVTGGYSFLLGTEIQEGKKFDDLVFEFTKDGKKFFRLLQAKHKYDKTKTTITVDSLLSETYGDFSLPKYFFSYQEAKKERLFKDGIINDVTICTNITFNDEVFSNEIIKLERINDEDDILDINIGNNVQPVRYKFNEEIIPILKPKLNYYLSKSKKVLSNYTDDEVKDFLDHLVFAVDCPSEEELGNIIKEEIGKEFDFVTTENLYSRFLMTMLDWLQGKDRGRFISYEEGKNFFEEARKGIPVLFNVRSPVTSFTGRLGELESLHKLLGLDPETGQTVCIAGIGGVGKTELARKYVSVYMNFYDNNIVWLNAESPHTLEESFRSLATNKLGIVTKNADGEKKSLICIVEDIYRSFSYRQCLMIFDNALYYKSENQIDEGIAKFMPSLLPNATCRPHVLITSRNKKWPSTVRVLPLDVFNEEEATEFIRNALHTDNGDIIVLARELQFFPLAMQQAIAYIKKQDTKLRNLGSKFQINDYIEKFKKKSKEVLNFKFPMDSDSNYTQTTYVTWNVTLDLIRQSECGYEAINIVNVMSYMAPQDIPTDIFLCFADDQEILASALEILKQYSMITIEHKILDFDQHVVVMSVHRLVQQVIRMKLMEQKKDKLVLEIAHSIFTNRENVNARTLDHAMSVWSYVSGKDGLQESKKKICALTSSYISLELLINENYQVAYSFGKKAVEVLSSLTPDRGVNGCLMIVKQNIAVALQALGKYDTSLEHFRDAASASASLLGNENPYTLMTRGHIAKVLVEKGKYNEALELSQELLHTQKKTLGDEHSTTLCNKITIAEILNLQGKHDKAFPILEEVVKAKSVTENTESKVLLGNVLHQQGKHNDALRMFQGVCEVKKNTKKSDLDLLNCKFGLAQLNFTDKKYPEALHLFDEVLEMGKIMFGEDHPHELWTRSIMAEILRNQSKFDKALKLFEEVYEKQKNILGVDHPDTLETRFGIAITLEDIGKLNESLKIYQEVFNKRQLILGNEHPRTIEANNSIADIYCRQREYDKALRHYHETIKIHKSKKDVVAYLRIRMKVGNIHVLKNESHKALQIYQDVLKKMEKVRGQDHSDTIAVTNSIAKVYIIEEKYEKALEQYQETLKAQKNKLDGNHPDILATNCNIANVHFLKKEYDKALDIYKTVLKTRRNIYGNEHIDTLLVMNSIADIFFERNKPDEALEQYQTLLDIQKRIFGEDHPCFLETKYKIGKVLFCKHEFNQSLQIYREVLNKRNHILGIDHPKSLVIRNNIAGVFIFQKKYNEALQECQKVIEIQKVNPKQNQEILSGTQSIVADILCNVEKVDEAFNTLNDILQSQESSPNKNPLRIADTKSEIAKSLIRQGKSQKAIKFVRESFVTFKEFLGPEHPKTVLQNQVMQYLISGDALLAAVKKNGSIDSIRDLISSGSDVDTKDDEGRSLMHHAVNRGNVEIVKHLLAMGADITQVSNKGNTCLHTAAIRGNSVVVEILLQRLSRNKLADFVNRQSTVGRTAALHIAAQNDNLDIVRALLKHGAIYNITDAQGKTPIDLTKNSEVIHTLKLVDITFSSVESCSIDVIEYLTTIDPQDLLSVVNARNNVGKTLLQEAIGKKQDMIARKLSSIMKSAK